MFFKKVVTFILLFLLMFLIKAHYAGLRLLLIAVAGLAGLYMIHILAGDYQKIQAARPKFLPSLLFKRSIAESDQDLSLNLDSRLSAVQRQLEQDQTVSEGNQIEPLDVALNLDPMGCAQWYVCDLATRPSASLTPLQSTILEMIRNATNKYKVNRGAAVFQAAITLGESSKRSSTCSTNDMPKRGIQLKEIVERQRQGDPGASGWCHPTSGGHTR